MINPCFICGDDVATHAPVVLAGKHRKALCLTCDLKLRRAAALTPEQLESARDEAHIHVAIIGTAIQPSNALAPTVEHYRDLAKISMAKRQGRQRA